MRILTITMLIAASLMLASCDSPPANTAAANKPVNNANAANSAAPVNTAAIEADVKKMITDYAASAGKGDMDAYDKMTTDNFMFVSNDGLVQTKAERMAAMKSGAIKYDTLTYEDVNVRVNPEGTGAVAISKVTVKGVNNNTPMDRTVRVTHVWSKMKDGWKLASLQATDITAKTDDKAKTADKTATAAPANANAAAKP
jgi:ketosteroid isomerase-like protein